MRKFNVKFFLVLLGAFAVLLGGLFLLHRFQQDRIAKALLWQADRARQENQPEKAAEYAVEGMHAAAGYLKERDTAEIVEEAEQYVKAHPMRSVAVAVVAGFFVGRMLR